MPARRSFATRPRRLPIAALIALSTMTATAVTTPHRAAAEDLAACHERALACRRQTGADVMAATCRKELDACMNRARCEEAYASCLELVELGETSAAACRETLAQCRRDTKVNATRR